MKHDIKTLSRLIVQRMTISERDTKAKKAWESKVHKAFPYEKPILTEKMGYWFDRARRGA